MTSRSPAAPPSSSHCPRRDTVGAPASAQAWPSKPIRFVVPFPPGGSADVLARLVGGKLATALGQPVIVYNRAGAGGIVGADAVAKAPADGYTLLFANTNIAINPSLYKQLPYDTATAFVPVALMVYVPNLFLVRTSRRSRICAALVELAKTKPGGRTTRRPATAPSRISRSRCSRRRPLSRSRTFRTKGAGTGPQCTARGEVDLISNDLLNAMQHVKAGTLRPLAITSTMRSPIAPDVPTMTRRASRTTRRSRGRA